MLSRFRIVHCCLALIALALIAPAKAIAAIGDPYDAPTLECVAGAAGENTVDIKITAGPSGAPAGVSLQWMKYDDYVANGNAWYDSDSGLLCKLSLSGQPSLHGANETVRWELGPNGSVTIKIGAINFDETGVSGHDCGLDDLECGTTYIFRAFAHATNEHKRSAFSANITCTTDDCPVGDDCTHTQGYWKTHGPTGCVTGNNTNAWPVTSLTIGGINYSDERLCQVLQSPAQGNCVLTLGHQLIAAMLNVAAGSSCQEAIDYIAQANALLASKGVNLQTTVLTGKACSELNALVDPLDLFNNGELDELCPDHCSSDPPDPELKSGATPVAPSPTTKSSWGSLKKIYR